MVGVVRPDSRWVDRAPLSDGCRLDGADTRLVAILRGEDLTAPSAPATLQSGDRVVYVAKADAIEELRTELDPW
jgi:Trk K+ transport system NAD-binding subunit